MTAPIPAALIDACDRREITEAQLLRHVLETAGLTLDGRPHLPLRPTPRFLSYVAAPPPPETDPHKDLKELLKFPVALRAEKIGRATKRYRSLDFARLLLERSEQERIADPPAALHFAQLAHQVLLHCPDTARADDLRVLQLAYQGAAARVCGDLDAAEHAFRDARSAMDSHLAPGLHLEARLADYEGGYRRDRRQLAASETLLARSIRLFDLLADSLGAAHARITLSLTLFHLHRPHEAIAVAEEALPALPVDEHPILHLMAQHNITLYLTEAEQVAGAAERFKANLPLYQRLHARWPNLPLHFHWLAGKIQRGLDQLDRAEDHLTRARDGFATHGTSYDAIMVCLDLALVYAAQRRHRELAGLADVMLSDFAAKGLHDEAVAAVAFAAEAARQRRLTAEIVRAVSDFLTFAQHDPSLRYNFSSV